MQPTRWEISEPKHNLKVTFISDDPSQFSVSYGCIIYSYELKRKSYATYSLETR
jgi:hypothetical protein